MIIACVILGLLCACPEREHRHRMADFRFALVEITSISECEIVCEDLEVPVTRRLGFDQHFGVYEVSGDNDEFETRRRPRSILRARLRGDLLYCSACKSAIAVRVYGK